MNTMFKSPKLSPQRLVTLAMLIALAFAIGKLSIPIIPQKLIISPTFIVNVMIGMIGGPIWAFISLAILDIVDNLSSGAGNFIIWWTLLEAVQGLFYGLFFYQKSLSWTNKKDWLHVTIATAIIMLIGSFIFTPLLVQIYYGVPFWAQFAAGRWLKIFEIPIRILVTMAIMPQLQRIPELRKLANFK